MDGSNQSETGPKARKGQLCVVGHPCYLCPGCQSIDIQTPKLRSYDWTPKTHLKSPETPSEEVFGYLGSRGKE